MTEQLLIDDILAGGPLDFNIFEHFPEADIPRPFRIPMTGHDCPDCGSLVFVWSDNHTFFFDQYVVECTGCDCTGVISADEDRPYQVIWDYSLI